MSDSIPRDAKAIPCSCGGYMDRVDATPKEMKTFNCGRGYECCVRAFVCRICKKRLATSAKAPEME